MPKDTSWGGVAGWYDELLEEGSDTYQSAVILPNLLRLAAPRAGMRLLDLACGQGFFSRAFAAAGADVVGADLGEELVERARAHAAGGTAAPRVAYHVAPSDKLPFLKDASFDAVTIVLAIQNIERYRETFAEASRLLRAGGKLFIVMNHPAFRIPRRSGWGYDEAGKIQYRRVDGYLSEAAIEIVMEPGKAAASASQKGDKSGKAAAAMTVSFHRSLQAYMKALEKAGFALARLEEWTSHKKSQAGPRQVAEDRARREIPLFMMLEAAKK